MSKYQKLWQYVAKCFKTSVSFDGSVPKFCDNAKKEKIAEQNLTIYFDNQCPYIEKTIETIKNYCNTNAVPLNLVKVESLQQAKNLPCVFNNFAVFFKGKFETVNLLDIPYLQRILKK